MKLSIKIKKRFFFSFIFVAIHGYPFFNAGHIAFELLAKNAMRVFAINSVGDFVLFLGKVFVAAFTIICAVKMLQGKEGIHYMWIPIVLAAIFAYLIAHSFLTIYEVCSSIIPIKRFLMGLFFVGHY